MTAEWPTCEAHLDLRPPCARLAKWVVLRPWAPPGQVALLLCGIHRRVWQKRLCVPVPKGAYG